ncbi:MAG: sortase domain-containing protein [Acidimicrobiales bacterium]
MPREGRRQRSKSELRWWATALAALIVGLGLLVGAFMPPSNPRSVVLASTPTSSSTVTVSTQQPIDNHDRVASSAPRSLSIPSIGVTTSVGELGLLANGQVMVPATTKTVGWFKYGPTPGQVGSSVILGHVDSYKGPGIFFYIRTLRPGALVTVGLTDGKKVKFVVTKVVQYSKQDFPDRLVYGALDKPGVRALNLVTCGGAFDHATGSYLANIVVFTRFAGLAR